MAFVSVESGWSGCRTWGGVCHGIASMEMEGCGCLRVGLGWVVGDDILHMLELSTNRLMTILSQNVQILFSKHTYLVEN